MSMPDDWIRDFELRAQEQVVRAQELSRRLERNSITATSPRGEVRLTVDSTGGLAGLDFGADARHLSLAELAALVLQTSAQAQARLADAMGDTVSELFGAGSETAAFVSRTYAERFPEPAVDDDDEERQR